MEEHSSSSTSSERLELINEHQQNKNLTSSELGDLFANYIGDSLFSCVFDHHLQVVEDEEIKAFLQDAYNKSKKHLNFIKDVYKKEKIPIPVGFGEQDVRKDAPRLFSDLFMVFYITEMARGNLLTYASAISTATRKDIMDYFKMCSQDTIQTYEQGMYLLLSKGKDMEPPTIPYPKKIDFIEKKSFISAISGKQRPLTALEIKHLQININTNTLGKALMLGFSQVASSDKLRDYFQEGVQLASKQIEQLSHFLLNDNLPSPKLMDADITDSTTPPYSDKLMLYHTSLANGIGIQNYGLAVAKITRHDLQVQFATLAAGIGKFSNTGLNMLITKGWLEEPPTAADREKLAE